jgi:hypothetical protein
VRARRAVVAGFLAITLLGACGGQAEISTRARRQLQARLDEVRTSVAAADRLEAQSALRALERSVSQLVSDDQLSDWRAVEILEVAHEVAAQLSLLQPPEATSSASVEPSETPSEKPDKPGKGPKEDKGQGEGKGND